MSSHTNINGRYLILEKTDNKNHFIMRNVDVVKKDTTLKSIELKDTPLWHYQNIKDEIEKNKI